MKKTWKRIVAFLLVGVMTFGIHSVSMAAPETANTPTDSPEPPNEFEQFLNNIGIKDLEGLDFESLPSGNTLIKMSDEKEEIGAVLFASKAPLTLGDFQAAGRLAKKIGALAAFVPKEFEGVIDTDSIAYLKDNGIGLVYMVSDNMMKLQSEKDLENLKLYYGWIIPSIKRIVPLNPIIETNPEGYDDILEKVDGKGVIVHFENEGELPGNATILAMAEGKAAQELEKIQEAKFVEDDLDDKDLDDENWDDEDWDDEDWDDEDSEENNGLSLMYINKSRELELVNNDAMIIEGALYFDITHTSDYLITDSSLFATETAGKISNEKPAVKKLPQTGDTTDLFLYVVLVVFAGAVVIMIRRRKTV